MLPMGPIRSGRRDARLHNKNSALVKALHDLCEHEAENIGRRLVVVSKPSPRCPSLDASKKGEIAFGFFWKGHPREIAEVDAAAVNSSWRPDIFVRGLCLFLLGFSFLDRNRQFLPVDFLEFSTDNNTHERPHNTELELTMSPELETKLRNCIVWLMQSRIAPPARPC